MALAKRNRKSIFTRSFFFYVGMIAFPLAQFAVFYIGVNFNSILLAFQRIEGNTVTWTLDVFPETLRAMTTDLELKRVFWNSLKAFFVIYGISVPTALLFSYYIYKKCWGNTFFKLLLFLPSILSAIVMVPIFEMWAEWVIPTIQEEFFHQTQAAGLLSNENTRDVMIYFYNIFVGFGVSVLMYSNAMSGISQEMVESAHLDGASPLREFVSITLPSIYPTLTTFIVVGVASIFTNQINLFSFKGETGSSWSTLQTYGYYLYTRVSVAMRYDDMSVYPMLSAIGLLLTCIAVPVTLGTKYLLERFGPSED